jgi:hypothetical protein
MVGWQLCHMPQSRVEGSGFYRKMLMPPGKLVRANNYVSSPDPEKKFCGRA